MKAFSEFVFCMGIATFSAAAQEPLLYFKYEGAVVSMNPSSTVYPSAQIGSPVSIVFSVDPNAADAQAANTDFGLYTSAGFTFSGTIGTDSFAVSPNPANSLTVDNTSVSTADWVVFRAPVSLQTELTFRDPSNSTLTSDAVPTSAETFNSLSAVTLFAQSDAGFGQYTFSGSVMQIPEPSTLGLAAAGLLLVGGILRRNHRRV